MSISLRPFQDQGPRSSSHMPLSFKVTVAAIFLLSGVALACQFDTDCEPGSRCAKARGALYGACIGGIAPGNRNDRVPVYSHLDLNGTFGNTCQFYTVCCPEWRCLKIGGIYGTCY